MIASKMFMVLRFPTPIMQIAITLLLFTIFLLCIRGGSARILIVDRNGSGHYTTISDAVMDAGEGDTIAVWEGVYQEHVVLPGYVHLIGNGSGETIIEGNGTDDVVLVQFPEVTISGFTIKGSDSFSSGIHVASENITIANNVFTDNSISIYVHGYDRIDIFDNVFRGNGEGVMFYGTHHSTISGNYISDTNESGIILSGPKSFASHDNIIDNNEISFARIGIEHQHTYNDVITNNDISFCEVGVQKPLHVVRANSIHDNEIGINTTSLSGRICNNGIFNNTIAIRCLPYDEGMLDASFNWYGDGSGPYHSDDNGNGKGNQVSDHVRYKPWLTHPAKERTEWYVDDDAQDTGNGSIMHPYPMIQYAIECVVKGDIVHVFDGTYQENVIIDTSLRLIGNGSESTTVDGGGNGSGILIRTGWVNVSGLRIVNCGWGSGGNHSAIRIQSDNCTIINNTCENNKIGILLQGAHYSIIENNICMGGYDGIRLTLASMNNVILGNNCSFNTGDPHYSEYSEEPVYDDGNGIFLSDSSNMNSIMNNFCSDNAKSGIDVSGASENIFDGNECSRNLGSGIRFQYSKRNVIANGTFLDNPGNAIQLEPENLVMTSLFIANAVGIQLTPSCRNITIVHNTFSMNRIGIMGSSIYGNISIHFNSFNGSLEYGILIDGVREIFVNATHNYWGHTSGPHHPRNNLRGLGDNISSYALFDPWLDEYGNPVYIPEDDSEDTPDRLLLSLLLTIFIYLVVTLFVVLGLPQDFFQKGIVPYKGTEQFETGDTSVVNEIPSRRIACQHCDKTFEVDEQDHAIRVTCPHCGENTLQR